MGSCIAFHSYKGGTGKTTLSTNIAVLLAKKGYNVTLIDLDVYAPSLFSYFAGKISKLPNKWLNDYLLGSCQIDDFLIDITSTIRNHDINKEIAGKLHVGFSSPSTEYIIKMDQLQTIKAKAISRFVSLKDQLIIDKSADYVIFDTSPGLRFFAINAIAITDIVLLVLKMGDMDIAGTRTIVTDIIEPFRTEGTDAFLLLNRVKGYCIPDVLTTIVDNDNENNPHRHLTMVPDPEQINMSDLEKYLKEETTLDLLRSVPCYCDIQFSKREFLTSLTYPNHPFTAEMNNIIIGLENKINEKSRQ
ncbi:MAG: hypothetical protein DA328_03825 [Nitrososphaeraceae archaeon]|nr:hypothetical protein [Nitrososphaeraceae archaeon]